MKSHRITVSVAALLLAVAPAGADELWGGVTATAVCDNDVVHLTVNFGNAETDPPEAFVGWVVDRRVMGACMDDVQITPVMPLPTVNGSFEFTDVLDMPGVPAVYEVQGVDAAGDRHQIYWPQRGWFVHAVCEGVPAVRGVVRVENNGFAWVQECPDQCWFAQSMLDANFPAELADLDGLVVDVFGEVRLGMEGYYVIHTGWELVSSVCGPVPVSETTWSAVKGRFR